MSFESEASTPAVFSIMLNAPPLERNTLKAVLPLLLTEKFKGELTSKTTSGVVAGTFAGIAFCDTAADTTQILPVTTAAWDVAVRMVMLNASQPTILIQFHLAVMDRNTSGDSTAIPPRIQASTYA
jgi:hypothetical protein